MADQGSSGLRWAPRELVAVRSEVEVMSLSIKAAPGLSGDEWSCQIRSSSCPLGVNEP